MIDAGGLETFRRAGAATVYEAAGRTGDVDPAIRAITPGLAIAGLAFTATCDFGDNLALHRAVAEAAPGDVLVIDAGGGAFGHLGDILAEAAVARGIAGIVIDGAVRDAAELRRMRFPTWARGLAIRSATKTKPGVTGVVVTVGGVRIAPGDLVVADDDGACAVAAASIAATLAATEKRLAAEAGIRERLRAGALTLDLLGLRKYLDGAETSART
jgi:4-hydroxy-4-methyl-2-oxoglutarate aldolase